MKFETGMRINHPKYGDGVIRKLDSKDNEFAVLCKFNDISRSVSSFELW